LPDRITIFQGPHERLANGPEHMARLVEDTVWHEVAHYFGMDESRVRAPSGEEEGKGGGGRGSAVRMRHVDVIGEGARKGRCAAPDEQDAIASQILASLADDCEWKARFAGKRDVIRRMAREALDEDERGETLPLDDLL